MTVTEIITELQDIQNYNAGRGNTINADIERICKLTQKLALHVKQLQAEWEHFKRTGEHGGNK
jgi:hypothetical protein